MPNTLIPIQTYTLTGTTASVTFSNIPQNYTDLKLVMSGRSSGNESAGGALCNVTVNGSGSNLSSKVLGGNGSTPYSSNDASYFSLRINPGDISASTFGNSTLYIPNYAGSTVKTLLADHLWEASQSLARIEATVGQFNSSAAITSITLTPGVGSFVSGSTFTLYGISNGKKATGGTFIAASGYGYHVFTSTGAFIPTEKITNAEVLMVAGGGGGGAGNDAGSGAGGGGAGGVVYSSGQTLFAGNFYTAAVGAGGSAGTSGGGNGGTGANSLFSSITVAQGGGYGAYSTGSGNASAGGNGGSGGGAANWNANGTTSGGTGTVGQGNNGGSVTGAGGGRTGGGGGGAGTAGTNGSTTGTSATGNGGNGTTAYNAWHIATGTGVASAGSYYIAGGGGGAGDSEGNAGTGGAGGGAPGRGYSNSGSKTADSGTVNTGGGGGGCVLLSGAGPMVGGAGGSGLIIVRYRLD